MSGKTCSTFGAVRTSEKQAMLLLHLCVFIWGFTAILGNLITLRETVLVWYRMGITSLSLLFLPAFWRGIRTIRKQDAWRIASVGIMVSVHWVTFYGAIKYANVSVALTCLATVSFFTSLLEPLFFKSRHRFTEILFGLAVIPALYMVFRFTGSYATGMIMGVFSAFLAAVFTILNKRLTVSYDPFSITFLELATGFVFLGLLMPVYLQWFPGTPLLPSGADIGYLLILSLVCTTLPFILSLISLRHISAFTANLTINLEPVYGILLAMLFFHEQDELQPGFYLGAGIILVIVFLHAYIRYRQKKKQLVV
ncbi:MAG: DMT family transporter [Chitinophagales bacterium]|nr:DMT family transporter [Chitinophagales bacterium]MCB9022027.1 DMT family transporter [Chitinophagales bacterium]HQU38237.1 DMT family transporter [Chitinophagales bacterium]